MGHGGGSEVALFVHWAEDEDQVGVQHFPELFVRDLSDVETLADLQVLHSELFLFGVRVVGAQEDQRELRVDFFQFVEQLE